VKVIVQIPCLNEEQTLPLVLRSIPQKITGVDSVEILIIDDGSSDKTVEIAKKLGVTHFVHHARRRGLARSFQDGINCALGLGADIIVNTDGDNQYPQERIADLVQPIIRGRADIVIADRQIKKIEHFSFIKKFMQRLGTRVLNIAAGTNVPDAPSGFRAYSRQAAMQLNVVTRFSYAMETIIQAGNKQMAIESLAIETNPKTRESRLFKSPLEHIFKSGSAIVRAFVMYKPYVVFVTLGVLLLIISVIPFARWFYLVEIVHQHGNRHLQSLILGSVLMIGSFISFTLGVIADLIRMNRVLAEEALEHAKHTRFDA
jgi:glycosyltransferase involved in cell wall biosynthesis